MNIALLKDYRKYMMLIKYLNLQSINWLIYLKTKLPDNIICNLYNNKLIYTFA